MKEWRKAYLRKVETKAFTDSDFVGAFQAVLEREEATHETIDKDIVAAQLIWHWDRIKNPKGTWYQDDKDVLKQKYNYKRVTNNLLRHFTPEDIKGFYQNMGCVEIQSNTVKLI